MANFQTHLTASSLLGLGYGGAGYALYGLAPSSCALAAGLCGLSGMLPDIDSGPGRPLREIAGCLGAIVPTLLLGRLQHSGLSQDSVILAWAAIYVAIRFGLAELLKHLTEHRGMFHSFPAAAIFAELTFLLIYADNTALRCYMAGAVVVGFLSHLCLDEIYSVQWDGRPRLKKSFGTAMKFTGEGWWPNITTYAKLGLLTFLVIKEPGLFHQIHDGQTAAAVQQIARDLPGSMSSPTSATAKTATRSPAPQTPR